MIRRVLIANRGEIAIRIARGARECGIVPVGVYSDADERAPFREALDDSLRIGPGPAVESYLDADAIIAAAKSLGADAIHPGYGFLSERAAFARATIDAGLIFVGPSPDAIAAMGSKIAAKERVRAAGVPVVPGYDGADQSDAALRREAAAIGTPLLVKASGGGGGRGMRVVNDLTTFDDALGAARREATAAFGDDTMLLERYLQRPRHIEFQILADNAGTTIHIGERECSIQRRHQKVIEESPSIALDPALRARMGDAAVAAARAVAYTNAGTVEFMLTENGEFFFLEMNARLQVEHPVTELVYGIDLVHEQFRIAAGERLRIAQHDVTPRGWAIEARLNAEDPERDFLPQAGTITGFAVPNAPGVRVDGGVRAGSDVSVYYDSLLAKIIVWAPDRPAAVRRLAGTLAETNVTGVATNLPLLRAIANDDAFAAGDTTTRFLEERAAQLARRDDPGEDAADAARIASGALLAHGFAWRLGGIGIPIAVENAGRMWRAQADRTRTGWQLSGDVSGIVTHDAVPPGTVVDASGVTLAYRGRSYRFDVPQTPRADAEHALQTGGSGTVTSPMPGKIVSVDVVVGSAVAGRALLVVLEAMKMEHRIEAPMAGTVTSVRVAPGQIVAGGVTLVTIEA